MRSHQPGTALSVRTVIAVLAGVALAVAMAAAQPLVAAALGPALVTFALAFLGGRGLGRVAAASLFALCFGLSLYGITGAVLGAGYPALRAFRDSGVFAALVTAAAAALAFVDHLRRA